VVAQAGRGFAGTKLKSKKGREIVRRPPNWGRKTRDFAQKQLTGKKKKSQVKKSLCEGKKKGVLLIEHAQGNFRKKVEARQVAGKAG